MASSANNRVEILLDLVTKGLEAVNQAVNTVVNMGRATDGMSAAQEASATAAAAATEAQAAVAEAIHQAEAAADEATTAQQAMAEAVEDAGQAAATAADKVEDLVEAEKKVDDAAKGAKKETKELTDAEEKNERSAKANADAHGKLGGKLMDIAKGAALAAAALFSINSVTAGITGAIKLGADLEHLSAQTGVNVRDLHVLGQAFSDAGVDATGVGQVVNVMQKQLADAARGSGEAVQPLKDLRLSARDLMAMDPVEQFAALSEAIAKVPDPAQRSAIAMRLFGDQGAKLMPLFASGGAIDDARDSLGALPEILDANSVAFERIDTIMGRVGGKAQGFFVGVADQLDDALLGPLEELNRIDLAPVGQQVGAFIRMFYDSFGDGTFSELIGLSIQAGVELGSAVTREALENLFAWLGDEGWKQVLGGVMDLGVGAAEILLEVLRVPMDFLHTLWIKEYEEIQEGWGHLSNVMSELWANVFNFATEQAEKLINGIIEKLNSIPLLDLEIAPVALERISSVTKEVKEAAEFAEIYQAVTQQNAETTRQIVGFLRDQLAAAKAIVGVEGEAQAEQVSALERLIKLYDATLAKQAELAKGAKGEPTAEAGPAAPKELTPREWLASLEDVGGQLTYIYDALEQTMSLSEMTGAALQGTFEGVSESIDGLLNGTMSLSDALENISSSIVGAIIKSFSDMAAAYLVNQVLIRGAMMATSAISSALRAKESAETIATETAKTPVLLTNAAATSVSSYGAAAVIGGALLLALLASVAAFEEGGRITGGEQLIRVNEKGKSEYVVSGRSPADNDPYLAWANSGGRIGDLLETSDPTSGGLLAPPPAPAAPSAVPIGAPGSTTTQAADRNLHVAIFDKRQSVADYMSSADGEVIIMDTFNRNRHRFGL